MVAPGQEGSVITILSRTVVVFIVMGYNSNGSHRKSAIQRLFYKNGHFYGF